MSAFRNLLALPIVAVALAAEEIHSHAKLTIHEGIGHDTWTRSPHGGEWIE